MNASSTPWFSIVIPMYNREALISRAIDSCLRQSFNDFEIIVVDDGSADDSVGVVRGITDPRISLICHEVNRGVCPARNTGISAANGRWIICLDSDDELIPGALSTMHLRTSKVGEEIDNVRFMCVFDSELLSPDPPFNDETFDYEAYLRWLDMALLRRSESLICVRRTTFRTVRYPDDQSLELLYHLDFSRSFLIHNCRDVVRLYHQDADNSFCWSFSPDRELRTASDRARSMELIIHRHGKALRQFAPLLFSSVLRSSTVLQLMSGHRVLGLKNALRCLRFGSASLGVLIVILVGMLGPRALVWLKSVRRQRRAAAVQAVREMGS